MVAHGHYTFAGDTVTLTTEDGTPLQRGSTQALTARKARGARDHQVWSAAVPSGGDAEIIAKRLLHTKVSSERSGSDFNRELRYPRMGIV